MSTEVSAVDTRMEELVQMLEKRLRVFKVESRAVTIPEKESGHKLDFVCWVPVSSYWIPDDWLEQQSSLDEIVETIAQGVLQSGVDSAKRLAEQFSPAG